MKKRSHKNDRRRLTLPERLDTIARELHDRGFPATATDLRSDIHGGEIRAVIAQHMRAHARATLSRERARRGKEPQWRPHPKQDAFMKQAARLAIYRGRGSR